MAGPDWREVEDRLYAESEAAISRFVAEHPEEECSFFAFETQPFYGTFNLNFDTSSNSIRSARENELRARQRRDKMMAHEWSWQASDYFIGNPEVVDHSPSVGYFAYPLYAEVRFDGWEEFARSEDYPKGDRGPNPDDYLEGNVRIVLWKVIERLITSGAIERLRLATPFRLGYEIHDQGLVVTRIIHWPDPVDPNR